MGALCNIQIHRKIRIVDISLDQNKKKRLSKNRTQSMHPNQMGALINRKIKNVDISLDRSKKTILQKVCTLKMFGLHAFARGDQTSIVEKPLVRRARLKVTQMATGKVVMLTERHDCRNAALSEIVVTLTKLE